MNKPEIEIGDIFTPAEVAAKLSVSERTLREIARKHGCYHTIGKKLFLTIGDIEALLEATKGKPKVTRAVAQTVQPAYDTDALLRRIEESQRAKRREKRKPASRSKGAS